MMTIINHIPQKSVGLTTSDTIQHAPFTLDERIARAVRQILTKELSLPSPKTLSKQQIIPIDSIQEAQSLLKTLNRKDAVLFDIDGVLTIPKALSLHPGVFEKNRRIVRERLAPLAKEQRLVFKHLIAGSPAKIIEKATPAIISELQKRHITTLGFTNAVPNKIHPNLPAFHLIREARLKKLGIHFERTNFPNKTYTQLNPVKNSYPSLVRGILYACGSLNTKGDVLIQFLRDNPTIETVIRFEDQEEHLLSETNAMKTNFPNINYIGFLYNRTKSLPTPEQGLQAFQKDISFLIKLAKEQHD